MRIPDLSDIQRWWFEIKLGGIATLAFAWGYAGRMAQEAMWPRNREHHARERR